ncbi:MAG TPA: tRNA lysidine(34) synthetase TilS [Gemmatimonadales bacterium]
MPTLAERFHAHLRRRRLFPGPGTALLAVSGGSDSVALLDLLAGEAGALKLRLVVAHADHGIHEGSAAVAELVERLATRYHLPFEVGRLHLGAAASETVARRARYAWLEATRRKCGADWLVTAHHKDDQAETVLLRALRGSAPAGLAGIPARTRAGIVRPLLPFTREELATHTRARRLPVHDDPANADPRHLRSWLRSAVLPTLVARLGVRVRDDLVRVGRRAAAERRAWDAALDRLPGLDLRDGPDGFDVARAPLREYDASLAVAVLRAAARRAGLVLGPRRARALVTLAGRSSGRRLSLGGAWTAEVAFDRLRVRRDSDTSAIVVAARDERGAAEFGDFALRWAPATVPRQIERAAWRTWIQGDGWEVRPPRPGDVIEPLGGVGRRPLRRLLMEARVPRSERAGWPVVARGQTILWVPGICRSAAEVPAPGTRAVRVDVTEH